MNYINSSTLRGTRRAQRGRVVRAQPILMARPMRPARFIPCRVQPCRSSAPPRALGDLIDDVVSWADQNNQATCLNQANAQVAPLDAQTNDLAANWNPTGLYTSADLVAVVTRTLQLIQGAIADVGNAPRSTSDSEQMIQEALDQLLSKAQSAQRYVDTAKAAGGGLVQADDLKTWVVQSMNTVSAALVTGAVMSCNTPWYVTAIAKYQSGFDTFVGYVKTVAGAVWDGVQKIAKVPGEVSDLIGNVVKLGFVAAGAYLVYLLFDKKRA